MFKRHSLLHGFAKGGDGTSVARQPLVCEMVAMEQALRQPLKHWTAVHDIGIIARCAGGWSNGCCYPAARGRAVRARDRRSPTGSMSTGKRWLLVLSCLAAGWVFNAHAEKSTVCTITV